MGCASDRGALKDGRTKRCLFFVDSRKKVTVHKTVHSTILLRVVPVGFHARLGSLEALCVLPRCLERAEHLTELELVPSCSFLIKCIFLTRAVSNSSQIATHLSPESVNSFTDRAQPVASVRPNSRLSALVAGIVQILRLLTVPMDKDWPSQERLTK